MIHALGRWHSWRRHRFVALDFEATGLDFERDEIVSFGVVPIVDGRVVLAGARYRVARPTTPLPDEAIRVHGLTPDALSTAPPLSDILGDLVEQLEGRTLVAHAAGVELGFLEPVLRSIGRRAPRRAIDVLDLAAGLGSRGDPTRPASPRLADLASAYGVPSGRSHHALSDALTTALLFVVLATRLERRGSGVRVRDLERMGRSQNAREFFRNPP